MENLGRRRQRGTLVPEQDRAPVLIALVRFLFRATVVVWGFAIVTALVGHLLEVDALMALSVGVRRIAPALTLVWLLVAFGRMFWVRYWPFGKRQR